MTRILSISATQDSRDVLGEELARVGGDALCLRAVPSRPRGTRAGMWCGHVLDELADWVDGEMRTTSGDRPIIGIIDLDSTDNGGDGLGGECFPSLNPADVNTCWWQRVAGALILMFPEIHWVLRGSSISTAHVEDSHFRNVHLLINDEDVRNIRRWHNAGFTPLFDPFGLRNLVKQQIKATEYVGHEAFGSAVPRRGAYAAVVEDERAYSLFLAYVAYRFGYMTSVVTSKHLMDLCFAGSVRHDEVVFKDWPTAKRELVFEDLFLGFPDRDVDLQLSDLEQRDAAYPGFAEASLFRAFVTTGRRLLEEHNNREHIARLRKDERCEYVFKPVGGVFDVWESSNMFARNSNQAGLHAEYVWPAVDQVASGSHSCPGMLLRVAERMLDRAVAKRGGSCTLAECVLSALLALDAQEVLGGHTPTTAIRGLELQHEMEVRAECVFPGVAHHIDVKQRLRELRRMTEALSGQFHQEARREAARNARAAIINRLVLEFRNANQFDEELLCLAQAKRLEAITVWPVGRYVAHHRTWLPSWIAGGVGVVNAAAARLAAFVCRPFHWYLNRVSSSIRSLIIASAIWIVVFAIGMRLSDASSDMLAIGRWCEWLAFSALTFISLGTPNADCVFSARALPEIMVRPLFRGCLITEVVFGIFHIGVLISVIFFRLSRR